MLELLDRLRAKPERYRKIVAIVTVSIITGVIFLVWSVNSLTRLSQASLETEVTNLTSVSVENASAFASFKDQFGAILEEGALLVDSIRGPIEYNSSDLEIE